jgi:hypothetical protein
MCLKCIRKSVRIGRPDMKKTCCNGVKKVHKTWENYDVKYDDISMKTITKYVINVWVYALQNALKMSTKTNIIL